MVGINDDELQARLRTNPEPGRGTRHIIEDYQLEEIETELGTKQAEQESKVEHEKGTFLVVDDSILVCRTITDALKNCGYHAEFVQIDSGKADGLSQVGNRLRRGTEQGEFFDTILMDVDMPSPNNGPSIVMSLDKIMHSGDLPYANMNFFTGQEDVEPIEDMLRGYTLNEPCGFYLKSELSNIKEIEGELDGLVRTGRRTRKRVYERVSTENTRDLLYMLGRTLVGKIVRIKPVRDNTEANELVRGFYQSLEAAYSGSNLKTYPVNRLVQDLERNAYVRVDITSRTNEVVNCDVNSTEIDKSAKLNPFIKRLPDVIGNIGQQAAAYTQKESDYEVRLIGDTARNSIRITFSGTLAEGRDYRETAKELLQKVEKDIAFLKYIGASISPTPEMLDERTGETEKYKIPATQNFRFTMLLKNAYTK
ncbi:response regulator [Candidatus Woesearchaeota archaeon]|jgi:CheY-like chemotaxis protein|nr:response regulator [Candidatus Woesearchaeota archaeon]MBT5271845.1 response regulator [Candidatus Woesearchaeota archaeon]MBT6041691.1 response regulator [Candidatus Woesearchaeota archaeon]MBT6337333.1 response regulator [Candidatus Woesearchaeota archaeon]MBT7927581.1 response regulator [Candidatus Woesearchaeota archaeon]